MSTSQQMTAAILEYGSWDIVLIIASPIAEALDGDSLRDKS